MDADKDKEKSTDEKKPAEQVTKKREHKSGSSSHHGHKKMNMGKAAELTDIMLDPPCGILAAPKDSNIYEWEARLNGPKDTPYEGGVFFLDIHFPEDYPFQPPKITFRTRIYHCNINSNGVICLDTIKNNWSAALTISKVLLTIMQLLSEPNPADPLVKPIAHEMMNSPETYFKTAQEWTKKYASPELVEAK
ncbi:ubiquitin-conjugating enzyme E2 [Blastocystis sp. ATCC 50177/Nand II]|uniref:E2 ubiquitin-conjugating enzyme n=1 Tax=Blastocystis sp. subtype 1 (strain ATCC 50177 / NandII) TaxID=478820 RepID=A0A196SP58_BLAHN|nr:ubiquitin-conjugating enzyme E2 [Blastocystis sp. ATCC 50177/Nand II]